MRFKVEELKVNIGAKFKDVKSVNYLVDVLTTRYSDVNNLSYLSPPEGKYNWVSLYYRDLILTAILSNKNERGMYGSPSLPYHFKNISPLKVLKAFSSPKLHDFVMGCKLVLAHEIEPEKELMSIYDVYEFLGALRDTGGISYNGENIKFDSDVPAKRLKLFFSKDSLRVAAGCYGRYRFDVEFEYKGDNFCIGLIHELARRGITHSGLKFLD